LKRAGQFKVIGDPTEGALLTAAAKAGLEREKLTGCSATNFMSIPFDSTRKLKSTVHRGEPKPVVAGVKKLPVLAPD